MTSQLISLVFLLIPILFIGCNNNDPIVPSPIPATQTIPITNPPNSGSVNDTIEFRVIGNIGTSTAVIKYQDSINGTTVLPAESLPYIARITSTQHSIFLFIEADTTPVISPSLIEAVLQVQIVINGAVFREGLATGFTALTATASGTWNH